MKSCGNYWSHVPQTLTYFGHLPLASRLTTIKTIGAEPWPPFIPLAREPREQVLNPDLMIPVTLSQMERLMSGYAIRQRAGVVIRLPGGRPLWKVGVIVPEDPLCEKKP